MERNAEHNAKRSPSDENQASRAITATAIDFLGDGSSHIHETREYDYDNDGTDATPVFACPVMRDSVRVVFFDSRDVYAESESGRNEMGVKRAVVGCVDCVDLTGAVRLPLSASERARKSSRDELESTMRRKRWKKYRGGSSVEPLNVLRVWDRDCLDCSVQIGVNLMFGGSDESSKEDDEVWADRVMSEYHTLTLNGDVARFYTVPNLLMASWSEAENVLQVEMRFFTTLFPNDYSIEDNVVSPLHDQLWTILRSTKSAMTLFDGNIEMGARLLMLDILSAAVNCWIDFLDLVREKSAWKPKSFSHLEKMIQSKPILGDREHIADFSRSIRDLVQAVTATIDAIELVENFNAQQKLSFKHIVMKQRTQHEVLRNYMKDIEDYVDGMIERAETIVNEQQNASLKRLTVVASIFLPLTTACSLLSMSNRVADIGAVWWDWLGIVVIIGFLVVGGYRISSAWHDLWQKPHLQWSLRKFSEQWNVAKAQVLLKSAPHKSYIAPDGEEGIVSQTVSDIDAHNQLTQAIRRGEVSPEEAAKWQKMARLRTLRMIGAGGNASPPLIPLINRLIFRLAKYLLVLGMVASFLVGMFIDVRTGAIALGYSVAGVVAFVVVGVIVATILRFVGLRMLASSTPTHGESRHSPQTRSRIDSGEREEEEEARHAGQGRTRQFFMGSVKIVIIAVGLLVGVAVALPAVILYWISTIFLGTLIFRVALQMLADYIPSDTLDDLKRMFRRKKQSADPEAETSRSDSSTYSSRSRVREGERRKHDRSSSSKGGKEMVDGNFLRQDLLRGVVQKGRRSEMRRRSRARGRSPDIELDREGKTVVVPAEVQMATVT